MASSYAAPRLARAALLSMIGETSSVTFHYRTGNQSILRTMRWKVMITKCGKW